MAEAGPSSPIVPTISPDFLVIVQTNAHLSHVRAIDSGAFGEVHEVRDPQSGQVFARKIIRIYGSVTEDDIKNEMRAVSKLCMNSNTHQNIVSVLAFGKLSHFLYYIDMELCDLNLERWIYGKWDQNTAKRLPHLTVELPPRARMGQVWDIMEDITRAVAFIHDEHEIHRDLKPSNVLYSLANEAWKVTDFGFTMEGSSRKALTSKTSRGTNCYRAPELLLDTDPRYTNKVDMWAVGCILYELVFRGRAFREDYYIFKYAESSQKLQLELTAEVVPDARKRDFLAKVICELLDVEPERRPRARDLYERFISWGSDGAATVTRTGTSAMETTTVVNEAVVHENVNSATDPTQPDADPSPGVSKVAGASPNPLPSQLEANVDEAPVDPHLFRDVPTAADYPKEAVDTSASNMLWESTTSVDPQSLVGPDLGEEIFHSQERETMPPEHMIDIVTQVEPNYSNETPGEQLIRPRSTESLGEGSEPNTAHTKFNAMWMLDVAGQTLTRCIQVLQYLEQIQNVHSQLTVFVEEVTAFYRVVWGIEMEARELVRMGSMGAHARLHWDAIWVALCDVQLDLRDLYIWLDDADRVGRLPDLLQGMNLETHAAIEICQAKFAHFQETSGISLAMIQAYSPLRKEIFDDSDNKNRTTAIRSPLNEVIEESTSQDSHPTKSENSPARQLASHPVSTEMLGLLPPVISSSDPMDSESPTAVGFSEASISIHPQTVTAAKERNAAVPPDLPLSSGDEQLQPIEPGNSKPDPVPTSPPTHRRLLSWKTNRNNTLVLITISAHSAAIRLNFIFYELWSIETVTKIWSSEIVMQTIGWTYWPEPAFSVDGTSFAYASLKADMPFPITLLSLWGIDSAKKVLRAMQPVDLTSYLEMNRSAMQVKTLAIAANCTTVALHLKYGVCRFQRIRTPGNVPDIDRITAPDGSLFQYDTDGKRLFLLYVVQSRCYIAVWNGEREDTKSFDLWGKEAADGIGLRRLGFSVGGTLIICVKCYVDFRPMWKRLFTAPKGSSRMHFLLIDVKYLELVSSTAAHEFVRLLGFRRIVDTSQCIIHKIPAELSSTPGVDNGRVAPDNLVGLSDDDDVMGINDEGELYRIVGVDSQFMKTDVIR